MLQKEVHLQKNVSVKIKHKIKILNQYVRVELTYCSSFSDFLLLRNMQRKVGSLLSQQFAVRALLLHDPTSDDGDAVRVLDGRQSVRDHDARAALLRPIQRLLNDLKAQENIAN